MMTRPTPPFGFLDRTAEIGVRTRNLPHWSQQGAATFITFRTFDSLPQHVLLRWQRELESWLEKRGLDPVLARATVEARTAQRQRLLHSLTYKQRQAFKRQTDRLWQGCLDECLGQCPLRDPEVAQVVAEALHHYDGEKYFLDCFVVMPNHVHVIAQFLNVDAFAVVGQSWMRYTGRRINALMGRTGRLWQPEAFDHIIRSPEQFSYLQGYVEENSAKANLSPGEFLFWSRTTAS